MNGAAYSVAGARKPEYQCDATRFHYVTTFGTFERASAVKP